MTKKHNRKQSILEDISSLDSPKPPTYFKKIYSYQKHDKYNLIDADFLVKLMKDSTIQLFLFDFNK